MLRAPSNPFTDERLQLPIGGSPAMDDHFREWSRQTLEDWSRWAGRELVPAWRFFGHLYRHFGGPILENGQAPIWRFRLRWLAVRFAENPDVFDAESRRYLLERFHANRQEGHTR